MKIYIHLSDIDAFLKSWFTKIKKNEEFIVLKSPVSVAEMYEVLVFPMKSPWGLIYEECVEKVLHSVLQTKIILFVSTKTSIFIKHADGGHTCISKKSLLINPNYCVHTQYRLHPKTSLINYIY